MASNDYIYASNSLYGQDSEDPWGEDVGQYIWDSPQPDLPSALEPATAQRMTSEGSQVSGSSAHALTASSERRKGDDVGAVQKDTTAQSSNWISSSTSDSSSNSSSSKSSARKRKASSEDSPPAGFNQTPTIAEEPLHDDMKVESMFSDMDNDYSFEDGKFPAMGEDMGNLSLGALGATAGSHGFGSALDIPSAVGMSTDYQRGYSPATFGLSRHQQNMATPMTVQPSKTFRLGDSGEESPGSFVNSSENSPGFFSSNSPTSIKNEFFGTSGSSGSAMTGIQFNESSPNLASNSTTQRSRSNAVPRSTSGSAWPCSLSVEATPEKSRVETQIPTILTLYNVPQGIQKLHLPSYAIAKPKYQSKPPFRKHESALELSTMLVCASAMQKEGVQEQAFQRAAQYEDSSVIGVTPIPGAASQLEDDDPLKPLNGGPVHICQGCIVRERKRAARKKTKKADEEEEWARDEAKRVVCFNCPEVRDWCIPGSAETPVRDGNTTLDTVVVKLQMRIACYCRHQNEKIGFQVIFTIRNSSGQILAQAISPSIIITDDHKQPVGSSGNNGNSVSSGTTSYNSQPQMPSPNQFNQGGGFGMYPHFQREMPYRTSYSTNDLAGMNDAFTQHQRNAPSFSRQPPGKVNSTHSTASSTPRNLSRPASPTSPSGHNTKKRRSAGPGHHKMPSNLAMTRVETHSPPSGLQLAGPTSAGFNFHSPTSSALTSPMQASFHQPMPRHQYASGPPTPLPLPGYGSLDDAFQYFSAPTSQQTSRAPSPLSGNRIGNQFAGLQVPEQAALALNNLPAGVNINRPPMIEHVVPVHGPLTGGAEISILGSGFTHGLEVMFGDQPATKTVYWSDSALLCEVPAAAQPGTVPVIFRHQHSSAPPAIRQLHALAATSPCSYTYDGDDQDQLRALATQISTQHQSYTGSSASNSAAFSSNPGGGQFAQFQPQGSMQMGHQRGYLSGTEDLQMSMLHWLEEMDLCETPLRLNYDARNHYGGTLLSLGATLCYDRFVAGLLARGADPDIRDRCGFTSLMKAAQKGHSSIVRRLLLKGADPSLRSLRGYTAADLATSNDVISILLGAPPSQRATAAVKYTGDKFHRPSSAPSVDSLSGLGSSSQRESPGSERPDFALDLSKHSVDAAMRDYPGLFHALAAWVTWREQIASQFHHFQQSVQCNVSHLQSQIPALPHLQLPHLPVGAKLNMSTAQQYSMVRRLSELLSTPLSSLSFEDRSQCASPPAYEDIYPDSSKLQLNTHEKRGTVVAVGTIRCPQPVKSAPPETPLTVVATHSGEIRSIGSDRSPSRVSSPTLVKLSMLVVLAAVIFVHFAQMLDTSVPSYSIGVSPRRTDDRAAMTFSSV